MKNSFIDSMEQNIQTVKSSIKRIFQDINPSKKQQPQIKIQQVLGQKINQQSIPQTNSNQNQSNSSSLASKIERAIRNSSVAKVIYHNQEPEKFAEKCFQNSEVLKQIQQQISYADCSKILELKQEDMPQEKEEQITGTLSKFSPSFFGGWSQRYCILTKNKFVYLQENSQSSPIAGILNFNILSFSITQKYAHNKLEHFQIKVDKGDKNFIFKAQNIMKTHEWFQKINGFISCSQGKINKITSLSNYPRFWRKDYINESQFLKIAKTGDILLFRGKKSSAVLQRTLTNQQYDHIGVVLLNAFEEILIFQANGGFGVGICPWKKFLKNRWFEDQQLVAIRHLNINRNQQFLHQVTSFVEQNIGKQYKFSLKNYVISRYSSVDNEKNSYFCSSLVAKLYKKVSLLDPEISSSRYMPYNFSDKGNIKILKKKHTNASLDPERIIVFHEK